MDYTFNSSLIWFDIILVSGICVLIDLVILSYNQLFVKSIYHQIRHLKNKDDISYETIKNYPKELRDLLLEDDTVKMKNNIKPKVRVERGSIKRITHRILANDNVLNEGKEDVQIFPIDNKQNSSNNSSNSSSSMSDKKKKKIVKKKKKKINNNLIDNKVDSIIYNPQEEIPNIKLSNNKSKNKNIDSNNDEINIDINNCISTQKNWNEGGDNNNEIKKIRTNMKPFSNIRFNNRNVRNNRNDISKGQLSMQKDQTDRGLLKSNL
jgi:hypothetical protein